MEITDPRTVLDFQKTTFCGHVRSHVVKVLLQNIQLGHADYACYWSLELLCSGLVHTLWMALFEGAAQHVNRANPNVFLFLADAYEKYAPLEGQYSLRDMTKLRNNLDARRMVCEAAATVAMCRKNKLPSLPGIKPAHDFHPVTIQETVKAPSTLYGKIALRRDDPMSVVVPINEFCYCLRPDVRDVTKALYWMAWVYAYCREHKKQTKTALVFSNRNDEFVSIDQGSHVVWLFWECIRNAIQRCRHESVEDILLEVEQTAGLILSLRHAEFAEPLKEMLVHEIRGQISKHRGITNEKAILDGYEVAREVKVVERNVRNIKKEYGKFRLIGRIDGFVESENRIVDSKERTRFWESVPIYDEIQMRCYMNMMGAAEAELVERFPNGEIRHTKFMNDPAKWAIIQEAITKAVAEMNSFLLSDENLKRMISKVCVQCGNGSTNTTGTARQVQIGERLNL